jgi:hypothetical protein
MNKPRSSYLSAGAAAREITPRNSQFLFGYPDVPRYSTGVHDPLYSSALYLFDGHTRLLFLANDIIFIPKHLAESIRHRIEAATGIPAGHIMVTATHTHSGPKTVDYVSNSEDQAVPPTDPEYLLFLEDRNVEAGIQAFESAQPARIGLTEADAHGIGTNRRNPTGPADYQVPVMFLRSAGNGKPLALLMLYSMHPTVLQQDSTLISGDFPGMTREYLQKQGPVLSCPVLYLTGPCGNLSPRHTIKNTTCREARRLGYMLGRAVEKTLDQLEFFSEIHLDCHQDFIDLTRRTFPSIEIAEARVQAAAHKLEELRHNHCLRSVVRTAECDFFGARETCTLTKTSAAGQLSKIYNTCLPAEIQIFLIGPWKWIGWPGEIFVEYSLEIKKNVSDAFVISLANGELQGYIVTKEAFQEGGYEASNTLFDPQSGAALVKRTLQLLEKL